MRNKIYYCLPTYRSFDLAYLSVLAVLRGTYVPDQIIIIDNSSDGAGTLYLTPLTHKFSNVFILPQMHNMGVAASWNIAMTTINTDYMIIANDDIEVEPYTIERLVEAAIKTPNEVFFSGDGSMANAFSLFLLTQRGYKAVGPFDEVFYPAYFEDGDYARRMMLKGYVINKVAGATYSHVGSSTIRRYTQTEMQAHHESFRGNQAYYIRKWGGLPQQEEFTTIFNS